MLGDCQDHAWGCTALRRAVRVMLIKLWSGVQLAGKELSGDQEIPVQTPIHNSNLYFRDNPSRLRLLPRAACACWHTFNHFLNTSTNMDRKKEAFTYKKTGSLSQLAPSARQVEPKYPSCQSNCCKLFRRYQKYPNETKNNLEKLTLE